MSGKTSQSLLRGSSQADVTESVTQQCTPSLRWHTLKTTLQSGQGCYCPKLAVTKTHETSSDLQKQRKQLTKQTGITEAKGMGFSITQALSLVSCITNCLGLGMLWKFVNFIFLISEWRSNDWPVPTQAIRQCRIADKTICIVWQYTCHIEGT